MLSFSSDELIRSLGVKKAGYLCIALYLALLFFYKHSAFPFLAAALILIEFIPSHKWKILFFINIIALTFGKLAVKVKIHFQNDFTDIFRILSPDKMMSSEGEQGRIFISLALFAAFLYFVFYFIDKRKKELSHSLTLAFTFCSFYFLAYKQALGNIGLIFSILLLNSIFFLSYEFSNFNRKGLKAFCERLTFALPFWQLAAFPIMPVLMGSQYAERIELTKDDEKTSLKIKAVKQALYLLILNVLMSLISDFFESRSLIVDITKLRLNELLRADIDSSQLWLSYTVHYMHFLISEIICSAGMIITMLWMMGYDVPNNADHPHQALSIADLMRRLYFYYNQMILTFFIMPTFSTLKNVITNRKLRWFLSVLWGVSAGGIVYSMLRSLLRMDPMRTAYFPGLFGRSLYFILLGIGLAVSSLKWIEIKEESHWSKRSLATVFVLLLYFVMFISETKQYSPNWTPRFMLFKKLLGL